MELQVKFALTSGKIDQSWKSITNNEWNSMLPKGWIDKGFHLFTRMRERGSEAGIHTPSDLESAIRCGTVAPHVPPIANRYTVTFTGIASSENKHPTLVYDYDSKKKMCQVVTFLWK